MNHKEMTAHIRNRVKAYGVKASVRKYSACGVQWIQVSVPSPGARFEESEIKQIALIAKTNGLTFARGLEVDPEAESQLTHKDSWDFVFHA